MPVLGLKLEPLDTLFFRDGRPFTGRAESGLPTPQTLAGALRTFFLKQLDCDFEDLGQAMREGLSFAEALAEQDLEAIAQIQFKGPWLARWNDSDPSLWFPVPAALRRLKGEKDLRRLLPSKRSFSGWNPPVPDMLPLWLSEPAQVEALNGFISMGGLRSFLAGKIPQPAEIMAPSELYSFEERTGIGIEAFSQSASEGQIFAVKLLRLQEKTGFYAEIELPEKLLSLLPKENGILHWGGEGRRVAFSQVKALPWTKTEPQLQAGCKICLLTSPALIETPTVLNRWKPQAAALYPWQAVSGWDLALGGPKPLRWLLPAGSVLYFLNEQPLPKLCSAEAVQLGWGTYLEGVSDYV